MCNNTNTVPQAQPVPAQYATYSWVPVSVPQTSPNYAGVNIQIINPMVNTPNGYTYPQQTASAYSQGTQGGCYPAGYYVGQYPLPSQTPQYPNGATPAVNQSGFYDVNGVFHPAEMSGQGVNGNDINKTQIQSGSENSNISGNEVSKESEFAKNGNSQLQNSDVTAENTPGSPAESSSDASGRKTVTKTVVELSDDYIKTLENYLNSQDLEVRKMGAHEVYERLTEDSSRKDDPALTALVNKMLQDPSAAIRTIALSLVESRTVLGNDYTAGVLKKMQNSQEGFGQDAIQATSALLKMAGKTVEKEVEVQNNEKDRKQ